MWREHAWFLSSPLGKDKDLGAHLCWILDLVGPKCDAVRLLKKSCRIDLFCGFASIDGQGGFTLDTKMLARIADLGLSMGLDLYPPDSVGVGQGEPMPN